MSSDGSGLGRRGVLASAVASLVLAACGKPGKPTRRLAQVPTRPEATTAAINFSAAAAVLGQRLLDRLTLARPNETIVVSPIAVMFGLMVLRDAARGAARGELDNNLDFETQKVALNEIAGARSNLDQRMLDTPDARCDYANALWIDNSAKPSSDFAEAQTVGPAVRVQAADLAQPSAVIDINAFVAGTTNGDLSNAISEIPAHAAMILVSTMFFAGVWNHGFDVGDTRNLPFTKGDGTVVTAPLMRWKGAFGYLESDSLQAVVLPYGDARYELVLVLAKAGKHDAYWGDALGITQDAMPGEVLMPRLSLSWGGDLKPLLAELGLGQAMGPNPDFGAAAAGPAPLSQVFHRTLYTIDEATADEGPKPTATTTRSDGTTPEPFVFRADRPFWLCLRETGSYAPIFMAKVADPGGLSGW